MKSLIVAILCCLTCSSCSQIVVQSQIELSVDLNDDEIFGEVVDAVDRMVLQVGGECRHRFPDRNYYSCRLYAADATDLIVAGVDRSGRSIIFARSFGTAYFWVSSSDLADGHLPAKGHLELEKWLFTGFSEFGAKNRQRVYSALDLVLEFDG